MSDKPYTDMTPEEARAMREKWMEADIEASLKAVKAGMPTKDSKYAPVKTGSIACNVCSPPFVDFKVTEKLDIEKGLEMSNPKAIMKLDLLSIPRREDPVEICEVCGAEFQGLYHCQSIKNIREIGAGDRALAEMQEAEDRRFLAAIEDAVTQVGVAGPIKWSARETVGIIIIDPERVQKDEEGRTVLLPTGAGEEE